MSHQLPIVIALGVGSAVLYAAALSGNLPGILLAYTAMLPLFASGLWHGAQAGLIAGAAGSIAIAVVGGAMPALLFAMTHALPNALLTALALRVQIWSDGQTYWYPPGHLLQAVSLWSVACIAIVALSIGMIGGGFRTGVEELLRQMAGAFGSDWLMLAGDGPISGFAALLPGVIAWSWMVMATFNGLFAQSILRRTGVNRRPSPRMADIGVPLGWGTAFGTAAIAGAVLPGDIGYTAANIAIVMAYPLFFQGLSVAHAVLAYLNAGVFGFVMFYGVMLMFGWLALGLIVVGLVEPMVRLRVRLARSTPS